MFTKDKLKLIRLPIFKILPNPSQPRKSFSEDELKGLAQSIAENGLLQPITVRKDGSNYYLIAGERRLRACKLAGVKEIPAVISNCDSEESAVLALLENLQRKDLQMFEQAAAMANLLKEWGITQDEAAKRLGISQSYFANKLRLLKLTEAEQQLILDNSLTERHARALIRVDNTAQRQQLLEIVINKKLNVSQTEELVATAIQPKEAKKKPKRCFVPKDIRLFINTIDHAVDVMKTAGIKASTERIETDEYIECTVRIPKPARSH